MVLLNFNASSCEYLSNGTLSLPYALSNLLIFLLRVFGSGLLASLAKAIQYTFHFLN